VKRERERERERSFSFNVENSINGVLGEPMLHGTYLSMHLKRRKRSRGTKLHEVSARFPVNSACTCRLLFIEAYWYVTTLNAVSYFPAVRVREAAHIIKVAEQAIITSSSSSAILRWAWFEICAIFSCRLSTSRGPGLRLFLLTACRRPGRRRGFRQFSRRKHRHRPGPQTSSPAKISSEHTGLRQIASR